MSRRVRLTSRANRSLFGIAEWTRARFGPRQADAYVADLQAAFERIAGGALPGRSARAEWGGDVPEDLLFAKARSHVVLFQERPDEIVVVDVLHGAMNLAGRAKG